jgi:hypothetical protein
LERGNWPLSLLPSLAGLVIVGIGNALTVLHSFVNTSFEQKMILDFRDDMLQHTSQPISARRRSLSEQTTTYIPN